MNGLVLGTAAASACTVCSTSCTSPSTAGPPRTPSPPPAGSRKAETWAADKLTAILAGHAARAARAAAEMTAQAAAEHLPATRRDAVGDFDDYWTFHAAREHRRLYPSADQQKYSLTA